MTDPRMERNQHNWKTKKAYTREQCDLWSLGCTLYFCATGMFPCKYEHKNIKVDLEAAIKAANKLTQNPDAIGINIGQEGNHVESYDYLPITELPAKYTHYPKWLVCTMTCLIRQFFHDPSIEKYAEIANAMRTSKRRKFLSIDQLSIIDHTDMSNAPYVGYSIPS
uniref:Protein kinase domain-containing protein n=1 Tax=Caenorhabditis japonica TaxID=281687 RepID=A0A8R1J420_CAEJA